MPFCSKCKAEMENDEKFCPFCGTPAAGVSPAGGTAPAPKPATEKAGNVVKCPNCGASIPALSAACPECGHELRNVEVAGKIKEFAETILTIQAEKLKPYVLGFPIPGTREDLVEFILLCSARVKADQWSAHYGAYKIDESTEFWADKCMQAYQKAQLVFGPEQEFMEKLNKIMREKSIPFTEEEKFARRMEYEKKGKEYEKKRKQNEKKEKRENEKKAKQNEKKEKGKRRAGWVVPFLIIALGSFTLYSVLTDWTFVKNIGRAVQVPDYAEIPPENVSITGSFEGYLTPGETGLIMRPSENGKTLELTFSFTGLKSFQTALDAVIDRAEKEYYSWDPVNLRQDKSNVKIGPVPISGSKSDLGSNDFEYFINTITKIEEGETKTVRLSLPMSKKDMVLFMARENIELFIRPVYSFKYFRADNIIEHYFPIKIKTTVFLSVD